LSSGAAVRRAIPTHLGGGGRNSLLPLIGGASLQTRASQGAAWCFSNPWVKSSQSNSNLSSSQTLANYKTNLLVVTAKLQASTTAPESMIQVNIFFLPLYGILFLSYYFFFFRFSSLRQNAVIKMSFVFGTV